MSLKIINRIHNNEINSCPECGGNLILTSYEQVCEQCGLVIDTIYGDSSYEINNKETRGNLGRQYVALGERPSFIGGLGSFIDYEKTKFLKDKTGKILPPNDQKLYKRLKKNYAHFIRVKDHETEYRIFNILNKIIIYLNLSKKIRDNAAYYFKKILKKEKKVINNISLIAFCIFYAARNESHNAPITIKEISNAFQNFGHRISPRLILRDALKYKHYLNKGVPPHKSEDYLIRLINNVMNHRDLKSRLEKKKSKWTLKEFEIQITKKCRIILNQLTSWHRGGRNPFILTGAIIYLADKLIAKEQKQKPILTQKIISEATKIAEYSIRDHYVSLLKPLFMK
ncbi:MAG: hypothetical protein ACTSQP_21640 [Promethearchaeota archaeon]